jgi:hypothetical protein
MPRRRLVLPLALAACAAAWALAWLAWPADPPADAPVSADALGTRPPAVERVGHQAVAAGLPRLPDAPVAATCEPLRAHEAALLRQRAVAALSSGTGGDPVLAGLLSAPPADDLAARSAWAQQLITVALRSQQAAALRWAEPACAATPAPLACSQALLRTRAQLEPDNAVHAVDLIAADTGDAEAAWQALAAASRWQDAPELPLERLVRALPGDLPSPQREALAESWLAGLDLAAPTALPTAVEQACGHHGPAHAMGAACARLTRLLQRADTGAARRNGAALARQLGLAELAEVPPLPPTAGVAAVCVGKQSSR